MSRGPKKPPGEMRAAIADLLAADASPADIARRLQVSKPTVCFHMRMLGIPPAVNFARRYDWPTIRGFYEQGHSMTECCRHFGFSRNAWWHAIRRGAIVPRPRLEPLGDVLAAGRARNLHHIKTRLLTAGLKEQRCESCDLVEWRGRTLALELHHMNGDGMDNRLENLRLLCPNCHSQTDTWGGRNKGRRNAS